MGETDKRERGIWHLYDVDYAKRIVKLKNRKCPRCSKIMGFHKEPRPRWTCGNCKFTEYVRK
ncbi:MAG: 30S ribosomal protein S27ae [Candidatus Bathyarchaeia archaeon]